MRQMRRKVLRSALVNGRGDGARRCHGCTGCGRLELRGARRAHRAPRKRPHQRSRRQRQRGDDLRGGTARLVLRRRHRDPASRWWSGTTWFFEALDGPGTGAPANGRTSDGVGSFNAVTIYAGAPHVWYYDSTNSILRHAWWG